MNSQSTVRAVIITLGLLALFVVGGGIYLTALDKSLPGELIAIGSAAAGAIGGILSRTGTEPQPVEVIKTVSPGGIAKPTPLPARKAAKKP